jgi:predicted ATPase
VPDISAVDTKAIRPETIEFRQKVAGSRHPWRFLAANMSDGTLRTVGVLVSLFQSSNGKRRSVPLIGIEEPEAALHPGALGVLLDALLDASDDAQIVVTSHSPDLLDDQRLDAESILAVRSQDGATEITPLDDSTRATLKERLYSPGELLRLEQLQPDREAARRARQSKLFEVLGNSE